MIKASLAFFAILCCCLAESNAQPNQSLPVVYSIDPTILSSIKQKVKAGNKMIVPAYQQLLKDAGQALAYQPVSVMEKAKLPPSGDKHDYMSIAPYFWPDSSKPDGSPYINKDGQINPEVKEYKDKIYLAEVCEAVYTLSLAGYFTNDPRYGAHATKLLRTWFLDADTRMNPNLNFAQAVKGRTTGRGYGLIDTRHFIKLVDAIGLLNGAPAWTAIDQSGMKSWFTQFLDWMQTSKNGIEEMKTLNNHGVWYDNQALAIALFIGDTPLAKRIISSAQTRLDKQMDEAGDFPLELKRTISLHYTVFIMDPLFSIATLSKNVGIDLWNYESPSGKSLKKGFTVLLPYLLKEKSWEKGPQILPFDFEAAVPVLLKGIEQYQCVECKKGIQAIMGDKASRSRLHLLTQVDF